ncbi:hypothetical protein San01_27380 [Streptomyces angustmyceticus]|uniref:Uncharacterized protein n=1 Tax=Streptomyces angustmyceticus TaxID=285578 RepID=A0A5J4LE85_9ACTN|nr:hypothetical protein San01_27380 [Streptomyces angustmyceticus]
MGDASVSSEYRCCEIPAESSPWGNTGTHRPKRGSGHEHLIEPHDDVHHTAAKDNFHVPAPTAMPVS